jgi:hypothetical protein
MKIKLTVLAFFISMLLTGQVLAFDVGGLSYSVINATDVEVTGRAPGNTATDIVIPDTVVDSGTTYSVTTIGGYAFYINALTSVTIGNSVTAIGVYAFSVNDLTSVIIPDSVTTIGLYAFKGNALTSVTIGNSVPFIGDFAFQSNALTSVIIPDSVTIIGRSAFGYNVLTSVIIPDSVTTIGPNAFSVNALTSVIIPDSVTTIGWFAFRDNALTSAAFEGDFGNFNLRMFLNNPALATITYCDGTTGWPQGLNNGSTTVVTDPIVCLPPGC